MRVTRICFDNTLTVLPGEQLEVDDRNARVISVGGLVKSITKVRKIMGKPALVLPRSCMPSCVLRDTPYPRTEAITHTLWDWLCAQHPVIADRDQCETDESLLQLLPYVTIAAKLPGQKSQYFTYRRGVQGNESRLHGAISLGIGGHIDNAPTETVPLSMLLQHEVAREVQEETGYVLGGQVSFTHFIVDWTNPVGRVHLGLHAIVELTRQEDIDAVCKNHEVGVIEESTWATYEELVPRRYYEMENWSKAVAHLLAQRP